jgi:hypothetical protein
MQIGTYIMTNYSLVLPFLRGGIELARKFAAEYGGHSTEHDEFYRIAGVLRENVWIQRSPPGSGSPDFGVISLETNDPVNVLKEFATSSHPWPVRFRDFAKKAYGIDFSGPPPPLNENIIDWIEKL